MSVLLWILAAYCGVCVLLYVFQSRFLFFPAAEVAVTPAAVGLAFEDVWLTTEMDERVHGWFVPCNQADSPGATGEVWPRATVVFCHGNGGNISHRLETLQVLHRLGLATLILDYPGYGRSGGSPGEEACYRAARAAERYVREVLGAERVILWGRSLGGAVAARIAAECSPDALVLESTFTSVPDMAQELYPWLPARILARFQFDTLGRIGGIACPKLIIHSRGDEIVPYAHGERLYAAACEPKSFQAIQGGHNDGFLASGGAYLEAVRGFLDRHLGRQERAPGPDGR
ncbi:MAG: alpha/beta hydrolase [Planctomycetota bacterium]|nr:MAG: alpha/beta hydrolase [Planctomycetota bacterium]